MHQFPLNSILLLFLINIFRIQSLVKLQQGHINQVKDNEELWFCNPMIHNINPFNNCGFSNLIMLVIFNVIIQQFLIFPIFIASFLLKRQANKNLFTSVTV